MSEIFFSDYKLEKDTEYFLYIGELKNYWLNSFLSESLSRILQRKVGFIAVVPDVLQHYAYENLIVLNPEAEQLYREHQCKICCRISGRDFMSAVSENPVVLDLVETLKKQQEKVYIHMFESLPEMTLDRIPGVSVLGPDSATAHRMNNKIFQYAELSKILPMPEHLVCGGLDELADAAGNRLQTWPDGIFVTEEYSAAGVKSIVATRPDQILAKFVDKDRRYLISRYVPHQYDPTVLAAVANENDVYVAGVADQRIEQGNRFTGSTYPTELSAQIAERLVDFTRKAGRWLGAQGYRGIFGCDYIVDQNDDIRFLEINARKQGTTMEFCCTLEQSLPPGAPNLPELEYWAATKEKFPENTTELSGNPKQIHWGTYNCKMEKMVRTKEHIPQVLNERDAFKRVVGGEISRDFIVLEHTGSDFVVAQGAFVGRVVALGTDRDAVDQGLSEGRKKLESSFCDECKI